MLCKTALLSALTALVCSGRGLNTNSHGLPRVVDDGVHVRHNGGAMQKSGQFYVRVKNAASKEDVKRLIRKEGGVIEREMRNGRTMAVHMGNEQGVRKLHDNLDVQLVEPVPHYQRLSLDDDIPYGIDLVRTRQVWNFGEGTRRERFATQGRRETVVCVIDDGLDPSHRDFQNLTIVNTNDVSEWLSRGNHGNHVPCESCVICTSLTSVTGTIAAQINGLGVVGVAPNISIAVVRVFNESGFFYPGGLIGALEDCEDMGAHIALCIAAAGNSAYGSDSFSFPASYPSVISVGAVDSNSTLAFFSQRNNQVDVVAPGVSVLSTVISRTRRSLTTFLTDDPLSNLTGYPVSEMAGSGVGTVTGPLFNTNSRCFRNNFTDLNLTGHICHCRRGSISFSSKVDHALEAGCSAVVISNSIPGLFAGWLGGYQYTIPILAVSQASGVKLEMLPSDGDFSSTIVNIVDDPYSDWDFADGTSMACPHVSGVAALLMSSVPEANNEQIRQCLLSTAKDLGPSGRDYGFGHGLVQADEALKCVIKRTRRKRPPKGGSRRSSSSSSDLSNGQSSSESGSSGAGNANSDGAGKPPGKGKGARPGRNSRSSSGSSSDGGFFDFIGDIFESSSTSSANTASESGYEGSSSSWF